jgi:hypothetical protein
VKTLVLYPKGGLANRLRAVASAKILADYTGCKLLVNWIPSVVCNVSWEELFENTIEHCPLPISSFHVGADRYEDDSFLPEIILRTRTRDPDDFYWVMPWSLTNDKSDMIALHTCLNFRVAEMTNESHKAAKSLFYRSLRPISVIEKAVRDMQRYFEGRDVVGIHIRRRDHLSPAKKDPKLVCPTDLFIAAIKEVLEIKSDTKFFLCTDDMKEERLITKLFRDAVIVYEKDTVSRGTKKGMQDALVDWLLLSMTSKIIGSYSSSFSEEAGIVNLIKTESVLRDEELTKTHYKAVFKAVLRELSKTLFRALFKGDLKEYVKTQHAELKREGLKDYFLSSYSCRKGKVINSLRKKGR